MQVCDANALNDGRYSIWLVSKLLNDKHDGLDGSFSIEALFERSVQIRI